MQVCLTPHRLLRAPEWLFMALASKLAEVKPGRYRAHMLGWLVRATVGTIVLGLVGYTVIAVPIGRRTLFEHGVEIFHTRPAQELVEDLHTASSQAVDRMRSSLSKDEAAA